MGATAHELGRPLDWKKLPLKALVLLAPHRRRVSWSLVGQTIALV